MRTALHKVGMAVPIEVVVQAVEERFGRHCEGGNTQVVLRVGNMYVDYPHRLDLSGSVEMPRQWTKAA